MSTEMELCIPDKIQDVPNINNNYITAQTECKSKEMLFTCNLCKISATSYKVLQRHYDGRKHKMRVERDGKSFVCELCQVTANSQKQLDNHLKSSRHKYHLDKKAHGDAMKLNGNKGVWIILFGIACIFVNFLILFKMCL